jgi:glucans biosynthesis protein
MSGSEPRRVIARLALLLLPVLACGVESEPGSTLSSGGRSANPASAWTEPIEPATPATLAAHVEARARALAGHSYAASGAALPEALTELDYEEYRSIRFRAEAALWRGETPFEVQLMHPGFLFDEPVRIHLVEHEAVTTLPFDATRFEYDGPAAHLAGTLPSEIGHGGFRIHHPQNDPDVKDEVAVFQGASYFRLLGPGQVHGLSSRGLAIDIGGEEEFPDFREFWLVRPEPGEEAMVFHALLDGPSVTGAYRFELAPGPETVLRVDARLFARRDVKRLGVAPLSSMFLYGPNDASSYDDFRPEVHDSDGLLMLTRAGEWIWRPLSHRPIPIVTALIDTDPRGFGLVQRARDFDRYLDVETHYHMRPSEWARLGEGDWGRGGVQLLEAPTVSEFQDNIAVSWVPDAPFSAGEERRYRYELVVFDERLAAQTLAQVERTGIGWDALPGQAAPPPRTRRRFIVDFSDADVDHATAADATTDDAGAGDTGAGDADAGNDPEAIIETSAGRISDLRTMRLPSEPGWRVSFRLEPDGDRPADMRLYLTRAGERLSETWSYVWYPERVR